MICPETDELETEKYIFILPFYFNFYKISAVIRLRCFDNSCVILHKNEVEHDFSDVSTDVTNKSLLKKIGEV